MAAGRANGSNGHVPALVRQGMWRRGRRMLVEWWGVLLTATLAPPTRADNLVYDFIQRLHPATPDRRILLVTIDNRSIEQFGRWPWPRDIHARLIERLTEAGVLAVGYDVLFPEAGPEGADRQLAAALAANGRTVLPVILEIPGPDGAPSRLVPPIPILADAARGMGHVLTPVDRDGVVRGYERLGDGHGRLIPHLTDTLAAVVQAPDAMHRPPGGAGGAVSQLARQLIVFSGPAGSYPALSAVDVVEGRVPADILAGRIVLVGATADGMGDRFATPMSHTLETMPGVELNANVLDARLSGRTIRPIPVWGWWLYSLLPIWLLMLSLWYFGPRVNLWAGLALGAGWFAMTLVALVGLQLWLPPALALMAIAMIFPLWGWRRLDRANRYMVAEMHGLRREARALEGPRLELSGDEVERQMILMHEAIRDVRNLREFVSQSLDNLPDAALVTDIDGRVEIANDAADLLFARWLGGQLTGRQLGEVMAALDPDPRLPDPNARQMLLAISAMAEPTGYEMHLADGVSLQIQAVLFRDADGEPLGWIVRLADITRLRASERQREDALRLLTHDMRAPQASILALLQADGGKLPPELSRRIARYAHQTLDLANDFVYLARAESGRYVIETFNLADALLDAVDDMWPLAQTRAIVVTPHIPDDEVLITGDRALLTRAITNLLSNAIKYSSFGSLVDTRLMTDGELARVEIEDRGQGIATDDLSSLFVPFNRLNPQEGAVAAQGAGLGLAFVKAVSERHRGRVTASSTPGVGSVFTIFLPLAELSPGRAESPAI